MTWSARALPYASGRAIETAVFRGDAPARFSDVLDAWAQDEAFRDWFTELLAASPFSTFRWETPAITADAVGRAFTFATIDAPELARRPADPSAFSDAFRNRPEGPVIAFPNLSGDATMIVPRPLGPSGTYGSFGPFLRLAPGPQRHALWQAVAAAVRVRLDSRPAWLSTAGAGVPWLHVRLDDRPKYYAHGPYRSPM